MHSTIRARAEEAIAKRVFPGCVIGIVQRGGERVILPFGRLTYERSASVEENTIYDLASVTKSIPLASLALIFIAEGRMRFIDPIKKYLPELQHDYGATIEDLLHYRVRGPRMSTLPFATFEEIRTHILENGFSGPPGEYTYTNLPAFLLGMIVERRGEAMLPALAEQYFFGPLQMHDTTFFPHALERVAPTEIVGGKELRGIVHDESARKFFQARRSVGHAGLFSTAPDILDFLETLLSGDFPAVAEGAQRGLGWQLSQAWFMGSQCGTHTFGKTGFTGTSVVCDMHRGRGLVILSNRTYPTRPADAATVTSAINQFRAAIADIVFR